MSYQNHHSRVFEFAADELFQGLKKTEVREIYINTAGGNANLYLWTGCMPAVGTDPTDKVSPVTFLPIEVVDWTAGELAHAKTWMITHGIKMVKDTEIEVFHYSRSQRYWYADGVVSLTALLHS